MTYIRPCCPQTLNPSKKVNKKILQRLLDRETQNKLIISSPKIYRLEVDSEGRIINMILSILMKDAKLVVSR